MTASDAAGPSGAAGGGAPAPGVEGSGCALRFERGRPIDEFSFGRCGTWQTNMAGVADRHLWFRFDGQHVVLRRDEQSPPVYIDGVPIAQRAEPLRRLPCRIEVGVARLVLDDQAPLTPVLDASVLVKGGSLAERQRLSLPAFAPVALAKRGASSSAAVTLCGLFAPHRPGGLVAAEQERTIGDGHATSVMPLDVMLRRGLIPNARAHDPPDADAAPRRRRALASRPGAAAIAARASGLISRWFEGLELRRRLATMLERKLAWGLVVPVVLLLCHALQPEASGGAAGGALEATAWAASHEGGAVSGAGARRSAASLPVESSLRGDSAMPARDAKGRAGVGAALPAIDAPSGPTGERLAVDALAAGDTARARALYAALAERTRDNAAFAEAARILASAARPHDLDRRAAPEPKAREAGHDAIQPEERLAKGVTTRR